MNMKLKVKSCGCMCQSGKCRICMLENEKIGKISLVMGYFDSLS